MSKNEDSIKYFAQLYAEEAVIKYFDRHYADIMQSKIQKQLESTDLVAEIKNKIDSLLVWGEFKTQKSISHIENRIESLARNMDALHCMLAELRKDVA